MTQEEVIELLKMQFKLVFLMILVQEVMLIFLLMLEKDVKKNYHLDVIIKKSIINL